MSTNILNCNTFKPDHNSDDNGSLVRWSTASTLGHLRFQGSLNTRGTNRADSSCHLNVHTTRLDQQVNSQQRPQLPAANANARTPVLCPASKRLRWYLGKTRHARKQAQRKENATESNTPFPRNREPSAGSSWQTCGCRNTAHPNPQLTTRRSALQYFAPPIHG